MKQTNHHSQKTKTLFFSALLLITAMIWGMGFIVVRNSLDYMSSLYLLAFRFTVGFLLMALISVKLFRQLNKTYFLQGMILGGCMFLAFCLQTEAVKYTTVGKNAFLTAAYVVFVPILYWLFYRKRPTMQILGATFLCFVGIGLLSIDSNLTINFGDLLTLICAIFYALHIVFSAKFFEKGSSPVILNVLQLGFAALFAWICALIEGPIPIRSFNQNAIIGILYLGIFCTMLAFLFQAIGQKHTSPSIASILLSTESVFGVIFSTIFLNEEMTLRMLLGCSIIFIALILTQVELKLPKEKKFK